MSDVAMDVVVAGEALVDRVVTPDGAVVDALGGAPFNVARALARLGSSAGLRVGFAGAVSTDEHGDALTAELVRDGVSTQRLERVAAPTTMALAQVDDRGSARYEFVLDDTSAPSFHRFDPIGPDVRAVVTGGLGLVLRPMADTIIETATELGEEVLLVVDVNCRPAVIVDRIGYLDDLRRLLWRADVVKVSDEDLEVLAPDLDVAGLLGLGVAAVVVTAGGDGSEVVTASGRRAVPVSPLPGPLVDTIGAGDTFTAGFVAWWLLAGFTRSDVAARGGADRAGDRAGDSDDDAGDRGQAALDRLAAAVAAAGQAAAVTVTRRGCDPPRLTDLPATWLPRPTR